MPDDYSLIGFDDLVFADSVYPSLTTVGLEKYLWGQKLAKYYFSLLEHTGGKGIVCQRRGGFGTVKVDRTSEYKKK